MKSSSKSIGPDGYILVGRITGVHGIRGGLKVQVYADSADLFRDGEALYLSLPDGSMRSLTIAWAAPHGRGLRIGFDAVADRDAAERLIGASLFYEKARLPALAEDTYYWFDLVGLSVVDRNGQTLGRLDSVIPTAAHDVYVVHGDVDAGGKVRETLLPAIGDVVISVDLEQGVMVVDIPEGL